MSAEVPPLEIENFLFSFESTASEEHSIMTGVDREAEAIFHLDKKHSLWLLYNKLIFMLKHVAIFLIGRKETKMWTCVVFQVLLFRDYFYK